MTDILTEVEELKRKRAEIDKRIKELTSDDICFGSAKFCRDPRPGIANFNYYVSVKIPEVRIIEGKEKRGFHYSTVCRAETREETIQNLKDIIYVLNGLYEKLTGEKK